MDTIIIPKKLGQGEDLVIIKKRDFDEFQKWKYEINDAISKIKRGRKEYNNGETIVALSTKSFR